MTDRRPRPTSGWSIGCSTVPRTASVGRGTGSTWCATPSPTGSARRFSPARLAVSRLRHRAFNDDKPYDRFVREQLAGDEFAPDDPQTLVATGYLRHGIYEYNQRDARSQWDNILNDITDVTGEVFLGLGMGCARCHDHKFDPILQEDYFRLQAFFTPLLPRDDLPSPPARRGSSYQTQLAAWREKTADIRADIDELERPLVEAARRASRRKFPRDIRAMLLKEVAQRTPLEHQLAELANRQAGEEVEKINFGSQLKGEQKAKWDQLQQELKQFDDLRPKDLPPAFTVTDVGAVAPPTPMAGDGAARGRAGISDRA